MIQPLQTLLKNGGFQLALSESSDNQLLGIRHQTAVLQHHGLHLRVNVHTEILGSRHLSITTIDVLSETLSGALRHAPEKLAKCPSFFLVFFLTAHHHQPAQYQVDSVLTRKRVIRRVNEGLLNVVRQSSDDPECPGCPLHARAVRPTPKTCFVQPETVPSRPARWIGEVSIAIPG